MYTAAQQKAHDKYRRSPKFKATQERYAQTSKAKQSRQNARLTIKSDVLTHYGKEGRLQCCYPDCPVTDVDMLTLDHENNDGSEDRKARGMNGGYRFYLALRREDFPTGYLTLCWNHQWKKQILRLRDSVLFTVEVYANFSRTEHAL